ncbi:MAG: hypothetical protein FWF80_00115, partial [Defluviitaleaceae bacterium]|nr:hypothetical protein [Defluviitaleaceae bacterium]
TCRSASNIIGAGSVATRTDLTRVENRVILGSEGFYGKPFVRYAIFFKTACNRRDFAEFAVFGAQNDGEY